MAYGCRGVDSKGITEGNWIGPDFKVCWYGRVTIGGVMVECQVAGIQGLLLAAWMRTSSMFWPWRAAVAV